LNHMASLTPEERLRVTGLPPGREHIFPTGLAVLLAVMDTLGIAQGTVTLRNNTDGFLYAYARGIV
jgi:exopolyphosphatase/pppGpp-phosphohydrolase